MFHTHTPKHPIHRSFLLDLPAWLISHAVPKKSYAQVFNFLTIRMQNVCETLEISNRMVGQEQFGIERFSEQLNLQFNVSDWQHFWVSFDLCFFLLFWKNCSFHLRASWSWFAQKNWMALCSLSPTHFVAVFVFRFEAQSENMLDGKSASITEPNSLEVAAAAASPTLVDQFEMNMKPNWVCVLRMKFFLHLCAKSLCVFVCFCLRCTL